MTFLSQNEQATETLAKSFASGLRPGDVLFLSGDLGAGKTTFSRALIRALTGNEALDVPSPTFTLVQNYEASPVPVWHFDLYRIKDPEEIFELGWEDAIAEGIVLVEWPSRLLKSLIPPNRLEIALDFCINNPQQRTITFTPHGTWIDRI